MKKYLIALVFVVIVIVAGFVYWETEKSSSGGWKTFINPKYNYSIQYPPDYATPATQGAIDNYVHGFRKIGVNPPGDYVWPGVSISIVSLNTEIGTFYPGKDLREWIKNNYQKVGREPFILTNSVKPVVVNGINGYLFQGDCSITPENCTRSSSALEAVALESRGIVYVLENHWQIDIVDGKRVDDLERLSSHDFMKMVNSFKLVK